MEQALTREAPPAAPAKGKVPIQHLRVLTLQESSRALHWPPRAGTSSSHNQWHFLAFESAAATWQLMSVPKQSLLCAAAGQAKGCLSVWAFFSLHSLVFPFLSIPTTSQQHTEGYNDVPGTQPKPVGPEAFIECKEALALPCLGGEKRQINYEMHQVHVLPISLMPPVI